MRLRGRLLALFPATRAGDVVTSHGGLTFGGFLTGTVETFSSGEAFLLAVEDRRFDFVLFDIYLTGMTGLEAAERLHARDPSAAIAFLTTSREHVLDGYRVYAIGYLLKPVGENLEQLRKIVACASGRAEAREQAISVTFASEVRHRGQAYSVRLRRIFYIDVLDGRVQIHLKGECLSVREKWGQVAEEVLRSAAFCECYNKVIVNMEHVADVEAEDFVLASGERVPIARRKHNGVKRMYMQYLLAGQ